MASNPSSHRRTPSRLANVETTGSDAVQTDVESPSLSMPQARARFEFELGKSNEGTKILMVEWEDDDDTRNVQGAWTISWEGKSTVLPAEERNLSEDAREEMLTHRMFFLLPPGVAIPSLVSLVLKPSDQAKHVIEWRTNPLPAIFPPGWADSAVGTGKASKGVLHTLWAKKRLSTLQHEIEKEEKLFPEGIGLAMAVQEKEWIETSFGLGPPTSHRESLRGLSEAPRSPSSPLSPGGSRLSEKLKGLKLQTAGSSDGSRNPLSPDAADIAVPSFSAFKGANPASLAAKPAQKPSESAAPRSVPQLPARSSTVGSVGSIASMMAGTRTGFSPAATAGANDGDEESDLFALPLSPRSPEMTKSPFTFASSDTMKYLKGEQPQRVV